MYIFIVYIIELHNIIAISLILINNYLESSKCYEIDLILIKIS